MLLGSTQATLSPWYLLWPFGVGGLVSVGLAILLKTRTEHLSKYLAESRLRRGLFSVVVLTGVPFFWAAIADWADITEVVRGHIEPGDPLLLSLMVALVAFWFAAQYLEWWTNDQWDAKLASANQDIEGSKLLLKAKDSFLDFLLRMGDTLLGVVGCKAERVRIAAAHVNGSPAIDRVHEALKPREQTARLVHCIYELFRARLRGGTSLRVAYFRLRGDCFEVQHAFDGVSTSCIRTPGSTHREKFRYPPTSGPCLVISAAMTGDVQIVPDAEKEDESGRFRFFDESQRRLIKSIVALPLKRADERPPIHHVITIDTDQKGFFSLDNEKEMEILAKHIAHRLLFEVDMEQLLVPADCGNGGADVRTG